MAYGLIQDIKGFYVRVKIFYNSPIKKSYAGYTVFLGIDALLVSPSLI
jgi:hypothetical protein